MSAKNLATTAAKSASYNIILQVATRILTFVLNAYILRHISKHVLGVINVRLVLLYTTVQFLSREGFRRACLSNSKAHDWTAVINLVWLCLPVSAVIGVPLGCLWIFVLRTPDPEVMPNYTMGVCTTVTCVMIELLAEPLYIIGQAFHYVRLKVFIEGGSLALRCILMSVLITLYPSSAIKVFSVSQIAASMFYTCAFYVYFYVEIGSSAQKKANPLPIKSLASLVPVYRPSKYKIESSTARLTWSFMKQTVIKQVLTEGERYVMTLFNVLTFAEEGVYDAVNNLGSLAARFIFQPIEESGYLFFAQVLKRDVDVSNQEAEDVTLSASVLEQLLKLMTLLGTIILTFGQSYSTLLLHLYGGTVLSEGVGPSLMRWHCGYVLFLALNGIVECFVFAAMTKNDLDRHSRRLAMFSVLFLAASYCFTLYFGSVGFIMANCLNMAARIVHGLLFIKDYYKQTAHRPLRGIFPHRAVLLTCALAFVVTSVSQLLFCCSKGALMWVIHVAFGAICFLLVMFSIFIKERPLITFLSTFYRGRAKDQREAKVK
ncbi:protein RFT1 homolog [Ornithodoros turicata]|uniref:protein RFT1 homolog n=1 Tax=Ornithodoros turicata TaxID=34597 RepID=UPI003139ED24